MEVKFSLCLLTVFNAVSAIPWAGPAPTFLRDVDPMGWSPKPTAAPEGLPRIGGVPLLNGVQYSLYGAMDALRRRQASTRLDTCGYLEGYGVAPLTCAYDGAECVYFTDDFRFQCCTDINAPDCKPITTCQNYDDGCDSRCSSDTALIYCATSDLPYCTTNVLVVATDTFYGYGCGSTESDTETYSFSSTAFSPTFANTISSVAPVPVVGTTTIIITQTAPPMPTAATTPPSGGSSSTPVGAIAGGVVGGVAVLAALVFAFWFFGIHKKKQKKDYQYSQAATQPGNPPQGPTPGGFGAPLPYSAGYNHNYAVPQTQTPVPQYTSPVQQYSSPMQQYPPTAQSTSPQPNTYSPSYLSGNEKYLSTTSEQQYNGASPHSPQPSTDGLWGNATQPGQTPTQTSPPLQSVTPMAELDSRSPPP